MSSTPRTKLRLVKCPKCAKILPEPKEFRVYACGGCNTVLQAKYYKNDRGSSLHEGVIVYSTDIRESDGSGSSHRSSSSGQQSFDEDEKRDHNVEVHRNLSKMYSAYSTLSDESTFLGNHNVEVHRNLSKMYSAYSTLSDESTFRDNEDCTQQQIEDLDFDGENSMISEPRLLGNEELTKFGTVNGAKEEEVDQLGQSSDTSSDEHESLSTRNKEPLKLTAENGEARVKGDEQGGYEFVECARELEGINLRDKDSTVSLEFSEIDSVSVCGSVKVSRVDQCEKSSPFGNVMETTPRKIDSFGTKHLNSIGDVNTVGNSMKVGPRFQTKESFANYEDCVSSFDGHDYQLPRYNFPPRVPPLYQSSEVTYETGSSSSYAHDKLPDYRTSNHPYRYDERSENRLRKPHFQRGNVVGRRTFSEATWRENKHLPLYYRNETSGEIYPRSKYYYHGYEDRKRRPYSSEMLKGRHQIPNPYNSHYRYPDDLRRSAQLCCHPSREIGWDPYESLSYPTSLMGPKRYPWDQDLIYLSDTHMMRKLQLREKRQATKRHLEPLAGGAPFVTCYICFRILRLPADFLIPGRRKRETYLLKCGSCSNILEFILKNECCLVSCVGNNDSGEAQTDAERDCNFTSEDGREMRTKDDSFRGSESEKRKPGSMRIEKSDDEEEACSSVEEGRQVKVTWRVPTARKKSPLHRLMGYSSPSRLLMGSDEDEDVEI